ncbi:MAG: LytTR family DNA-binding domain-containing protein [Acidimicrobiales bacterium]
MTGLSILAVDDEAPSLGELTTLLRSSTLVAEVAMASSATDALLRLGAARFDLVLLDVRMPDLGGLELARILTRFSRPPSVVFVTADESYALQAFDVGAAGYLLKPLDRERLERILRRAAAAVGGDVEGADFDTVAVESAGRTTMVSRQEITWVEAAGDYVRLHMREGTSHLLRSPISTLEQQWIGHGFVRIHRSYLVSVRDIREFRTEAAHTSVTVAGHQLPVSRRHLREMRDRVVRRARPPLR